MEASLLNRLAAFTGYIFVWPALTAKACARVCQALTDALSAELQAIGGVDKATAAAVDNVDTTQAASGEAESVGCPDDDICWHMEETARGCSYRTDLAMAQLVAAAQTVWPELR
jgi:hypothetical protein